MSAANRPLRWLVMTKGSKIFEEIAQEIWNIGTDAVIHDDSKKFDIEADKASCVVEMDDDSSVTDEVFRTRRYMGYTCCTHVRV